MIEEEVKLATCQVLGAGEAGTGWLISADHVLTAYHCLGEAADQGGNFEVSFGVGQLASKQQAVLEVFDAGLDVCLLKLQEPSAFVPLSLNVGTLRPGERWFSFGYPVSKLQIGQVLQGTVQQALNEPANGVDLDLSVSPETVLTDYRGMSGAALMTPGGCQGMLRVSVDNALGAVSTEMLREFLVENGLLPEDEASQGDDSPFASRPAFDELFESTAVKAGGGYLFLDGAHGIGKSTYCRGFKPESVSVEVLGVYAFSERSRGSTPALQAQPDVFVDWLTSLLSTRATGKPARLMQLTYAELIQKTHQTLQALAQRCSSDGKVGILFIDGINEAAAVGGDALQRFVGLLPSSIPAGLQVVIVGAGLDGLAGKLGPLLHGAERLTLPTLDEDIQYRLCASSLDAEKVTPTLVSALCERAKGHPLYLRYLVDLVNGGASEGDLESLPPFSGSIEDYYESIWAQLLAETDAINLLSIVARLRWGIPTTDLVTMLTPSESAAFVPTITRIRHLLSAQDTTEVYHSSFSDFVVHKTSTQSEWVQGRLAEFCQQPGSGDYGTLNRVFHGLLADTQKQLAAIGECQQQWVDQSVLLGAEPDVLLGDIEDSLEAATRLGTATDIVRLLLLSQRLKFRYDTLFAQSAGLAAEALIALGKTEQALRHILRYGRLIVDPSDAFAIARSLIEAGHQNEALEILQKVDRLLLPILTRDGITANEYFNVAAVKLQGYGLAGHAGADPHTLDFLGHIVRLIKAPQNNISQEHGLALMSDLMGNMLGNLLCVAHSYKPLSQLPILPNASNKDQALLLISELAYAHIHARNYSTRLPRDKVDMLLADIGSKLDDSLTADERGFGIVDLLVEAGAQASLVEAYSNGVAWDAGTLPLFTENRSLADENAFVGAYERLRAAIFLGRNQTRPVPEAPRLYNWEECLATLAQAVAWADAKVRHARATSDLTSLASARRYLNDEVLPCFRLELASRMLWAEAYFIPENILPLLYGYLTDLYLDCLPDEVAELLDVIEKSFNGQLGLYNEGFRRALAVVIGTLVNAGVSGDTADRVFALLLRWRDYVRDNVQNRHELVPELLSMVPLFARMDSAEEALRTYHSVLAASMGPSWYKEDQFAVMSRVLEALPADAEIAAAALAQIAGYLEHASGEMTFQRYVRSDKGTFIGELSRRGMYADAVRYFQHQAHGTIEEMHQQASDGGLDRIAPLVGMRYPGGALEEQASLLQLLEHAGAQANWRLRWALLEVYQHGDERYLRDWGPAYATIIQEISHNAANLAWAIQRIGRIAQAMNAELAWMLLHSLTGALPALLCGALSEMLQQFRESFTPSQFYQLTGKFGVRDEVIASSPPKPYVGEAADAAGTNKEESIEDQQVMPGTFGTNTSVKEADQALEEAKRYIKRRNTSAAIERAVSALRALQSGGWSIWTTGHSGRLADTIIRENVQSADELARLYGPLALSEQHVQHWTAAYHLIDLIGPKLDASQRTQLLSVATDHVREMVGYAPSEAFSYIGATKPASASEALLELLLWALDHPSWEQRDTAAAMVLWLLRSDDTWMERLAPLAFSMDSGSRADVAAGALDVLSRENPARLWERVVRFVDVHEIVRTCVHAGRFATLLRIADRASNVGVPSATDAVKILHAKPIAPPSPGAQTKSHLHSDHVPPSLTAPLSELTSLGVLNDAVLQRAASILQDLCGPYALPDVQQLDSLAARRHAEWADVVPDRWAARVRFALNVALFAPASVEQLAKIEAALRIYNPESLVEPPDGRQLVSGLIDAIESGKEARFLPSNDDLVFLDIQCYLEQRRQVIKVDLTSHLLPPGQREPQFGQLGTFKPTELPRPELSDQLSVCGRVKPGLAHFGALTPAIASPQFLDLLRAPRSATAQFHWRDGSTVRTRGVSRRHEVSMLAIRREAFTLPEGWRMQWILRINGQIRAVLHKVQ
ncbi:AVAST type 1 anti-phage system protease Avs1b [Ralstonia solanacearum]|uniref:AVAST type 1 anti-phage system protease Avs1b n=1 Tax=Ralstonia solanacearum TaxID=305 RepID=UPI0018D17B98|nr:AVAST type 1 anti-phage system protease Avs1b [Ralstonia solanacearum]